MAGELARALNTSGHDIDDATITPEQLAALIKAVHDGVVNLNTAKTVFLDAYDEVKDPVALIEERGLTQVSDEDAIEGIVEEVLADNAEMAARFRAGEEKVFGALMGQVMKATKGQASPPVVQKILRAKLKG